LCSGDHSGQQNGKRSQLEPLAVHILSYPFKTGTRPAQRTGDRSLRAEKFELKVRIAVEMDIANL
jgi:hypothetical protein